MSPLIPIMLERENVNDEFVTLVRWFAAAGERVEKDSLLAEVETSKANMEVYAPASGFLHRAFAEGTEVPATQAIGYLSEEAGASLPSAGTPNLQRTPQQDAEQQGATLALDGKPTQANELHDQGLADDGAQTPRLGQFKQRFSPLAAKLMAEHGLSAAAFSGKSLVRKQDVLDVLAPPKAESKTGIAESSGGLRTSTRPAVGPAFQRVPLSKMKRREAASLAFGTRNSVSSAVSVTCFTRGLRKMLEARSGGENASALVIYETSRLLRKYPTLNATFSDGEMLQFERVNVGFAMDDGRGLKVAVIPDSDLKTLPEITSELRELTIAYLGNTLTPAELANGTFTISDLSGMGVSSFMPLISENQSAILGVGGEQFAPESEYGFYSLTLTFDHQLSDGRTAALFLGDLKDRLSSYERSLKTGETMQADFAKACVRCGRTTQQLRSSHQFLIRSVEPEGMLCTLCAAGF